MPETLALSPDSSVFPVSSVRDISPAGSEWFSAPAAAHAMNRSLRAARDVLASVPDHLKQSISNGRGRPQFLYHFSSHPALRAAYDSHLRGDYVAEPRRSSGGEACRDEAGHVSPDDLAIARLRARAVREYRALRVQLSESEAAAITCDRWSAKPATVQVEIHERLGRHTRKQAMDVSVGGFSVPTLRRWNGLYKERGILGLAPDRKHSTGRNPADIPEDILKVAAAAAISTARADIAKAVEFARRWWSSASSATPREISFPSVSLSTWRRRILALDPSRALATLGKRGKSAFRASHSPDIERDYSKLAYNQLWQLDDLQEDFYGHSSDPARLIRPYAYVIMRVATRKWICAIACETPIVQDQVRAMLGYAMTSRRGGIPAEISFERGAVACDDYLEALLGDLGVKVHRTSMDGGATAAGAVPGKGIGHFQGKAVIEANIRRHHNIQWSTDAQVGIEERHSAPQNTEPLKALAIARAKEGKPLILPSPAQWQKIIFDALEKHNDSPHSGLPEIIDAQGTRRHMSPNEMEAHLGDQPVSIMPDAWLMLFMKKGVSVPVTRNGIRINDQTYGRFDSDLQALAGTKVLVHTSKDFADLAYVAELGRCVERYTPADYGAADSQFDQKRAIESTKRSQHEALMAEAARLAPGTVIDVTRFTRDATPARPRATAESPALTARVNRISDAVTAHREADAALNDRFSLSPAGLPGRNSRLDLTSPQAPGTGVRPRPRSAGRGLLSRESDLSSQLAVLGSSVPSVSSVRDSLVNNERSSS